MKVKEIAKLVDGEIVGAPVDETYEVKKAFASDLMSDVLRFHMDDTVLITGLCNNQTMRTSEMADLRVVLIGRDAYSRLLSKLRLQPRQGSFDQLCPRRSAGDVSLRSREGLPRRIGEKAGYRRLFQGHHYREIREVRLGDDGACRDVAAIHLPDRFPADRRSFIQDGFFFIRHLCTVFGP